MADTSPAELAQIIEAYTTHFPEEAAAVQAIAAHAGQGDASIFTRHNFIGHVTGCGFIVAEDTHRVLLVQHKALGRWLQPGGHFEVGDGTALGTAKREVLEETGLPNLAYHPLDPANPELPFDIDIHRIPDNPHKQEPEHDHYDFRYLFTIPHQTAAHLDPNESTAAKWFPLPEFATVDRSFPLVAQKITELLKLN